MLVSTKGRYALRVVIDLVEQPQGSRVPLKQIAQRQGISEKYLENILSSLVRNGVLSGMRGKGGGYCLSRDPELISVGEIVRLTEGSLSPVSCLNGEHNACERASHCRTIGMWKELDSMIENYLDGISVADLAFKDCVVA